MQGGTSIHRSAMFSTARCFLPVHPQPRIAAPSCRRTPALTVVSARPRRGGARRDRSWDDDGGGGSGDEDAIDESFFGNPWDEEEPIEPEEPSERRRPAASSESPGGQLRGSDVLRALQRATAAKMEAKKKKTNRNAGARPTARRQEKGVGGAKPVEVVGEARPIEIRREWAPRIRELELRVQQLLHKHHQ